MEEKEQIQILYNKIFGGKISGIEYELTPEEITKTSTNIDKCQKCEKSCGSNKNRQDLPYYKNLKKIETFVIAESPGKGIEKGELGYVFGWENFENRKYVNQNILKYENYFFNVLNLNRENTYITDAIKCYTPKNEFNKAFSICNEYLKSEIKILKPKRVLVISKQGSLRKLLEKLKNEMDFDLEIIPHPSNQNISKIKTVSEIFKSLGKIKPNEKWQELGKQIDVEYKNLFDQLKTRGK